MKEEGNGGMKPNRQTGRQSSKRPRCPPRRTGWKQNLGTRHRFDLQTHSEVPSHGPPLPPTGHPVTLPMVTWRPEAPSPALQCWGESHDPDASHSASQCPQCPHSSSHSTPPCPPQSSTVPSLATPCTPQCPQGPPQSSTGPHRVTPCPPRRRATTFHWLLGVSPEVSIPPSSLCLY